MKTLQPGTPAPEGIFKALACAYWTLVFGVIGTFIVAVVLGSI